MATSDRAKEAPFIAVMIGADAGGQAVVTLSYREGKPIVGEAVTDAVLKLMGAVENICTDGRVQLSAVGVDMPEAAPEEAKHSEPARAQRRKPRGA